MKPCYFLLMFLPFALNAQKAAFIPPQQEANNWLNTNALSNFSSGKLIVADSSMNARIMAAREYLTAKYPLLQSPKSGLK